MKPAITRVRELLDYDPMTGIFTWKPRRYGRGYPMRPARRAGSRRADGYRAIQVDGTSIYEHVLAWAFVTGEWPCSETDHVDRNRQNNAWRNLRPATPTQNSIGRRGDYATRGIEILPSGKFRARLCGRHLGCFEKKADARFAYKSAVDAQFSNYAPGDHHGR